MEQGRYGENPHHRCGPCIHPEHPPADSGSPIRKSAIRPPGRLLSERRGHASGWKTDMLFPPRIVALRSLGFLCWADLCKATNGSCANCFLVAVVRGIVRGCAAEYSEPASQARSRTPASVPLPAGWQGVSDPDRRARGRRRGRAGFVYPLATDGNPPVCRAGSHLSAPLRRTDDRKHARGFAARSHLPG